MCDSLGNFGSWAANLGVAADSIINISRNDKQF